MAHSERIGRQAAAMTDVGTRAHYPRLFPALQPAVYTLWLGIPLVNNTAA